VNLIGSALQFNEPFNLLDAPRPAPFYRIAFGRSYGPGFPQRYLYVPSRDRIRVDGAGLSYWRSVPRGARGALERMTHGLRPYPAPRRWSR
jgi:hypothetical protein